MTVVDSNTWVDFFNGVDTPYVARLEEVLQDEEDLAVLPIIVTEVLQGFRSEAGFARAREVLVAVPSVQPDTAGHVRAARLYRALRAKGVTVSSSADCIIAQACLDTRAELLSPDRDFEWIARHAPLRLWRP